MRENGRGNPPETNERLPYKTIVVVVGGDGSYALVHRGGGGPGTVDQDVLLLLLLFLRRGRCSCDSIIGAAAAGAIVGVGVVVVVTPVTGGHYRRVGDQLAFQ